MCQDFEGPTANETIILTVKLFHIEHSTDVTSTLANIQVSTNTSSKMEKKSF